LNNTANNAITFVIPIVKVITFYTLLIINIKTSHTLQEDAYYNYKPYIIMQKVILTKASKNPVKPTTSITY